MIGPTSTSRLVSSLISRRDRILQATRRVRAGPPGSDHSPLRGSWRALDDQARLPSAHDDGADANHRMRRVFSGL